MWHSATLPSDQSMAVSVVPIPPMDGSATDHVVQDLVGVGHRVDRAICKLARGHVVVEVGQRGDGHGAGHLAGGVAAHAVGDGEQARSGVGRVLVSLTEEAYVRADCIAEFECHLRSSRTVLPMRIGTPGGTGVGWVTFWRSR